MENDALPLSRFDRIREYEAQQAAGQAREAAEEAERLATIERNRLALEAIADPRERGLVELLTKTLATSLGSANGYFPDIGCPATRQIQAAVASYGMTPDYANSSRAWN